MGQLESFFLAVSKRLDVTGGASSSVPMVCVLLDFYFLLDENAVRDIDEIFDMEKALDKKPPASVGKEEARSDLDAAGLYGNYLTECMDEIGHSLIKKDLSGSPGHRFLDLFSRPYAKKEENVEEEEEEEDEEKEEGKRKRKWSIPLEREEKKRKKND